MSVSEEAILKVIDENDSPENEASLQNEISSGAESSNSVEQGSTQGQRTSQQGGGDAGGGNKGTGTKDGGKPGEGRVAAAGEAGKEGVTAAGQAKAQAQQGRITGQDAKGNLVDAGGNIVVNAGAERRLYEQNIRSRQELVSVQRELEQAKNIIAQNNALDGQVRQYGLKPEEVTTGLSLVAQFKRDPVGTAKVILQQVQAMGHTIEGIGNGVDVAAIKQMVAEELAPFRNAQQATEREARALAEAEAELNSFYTKYPTASIHEDVLESMLRKEPGLGLETAYLRISNWALQDGLDINQPLRAQVEAKQSQGQAQDANGVAAQNGGAPPRTPMPNGQSSVTTPIESSQQFADPQTSYRDIIRDAMREAGMNVNR